MVKLLEMAGVPMTNTMKNIHAVLDFMNNHSDVLYDNKSGIYTKYILYKIKNGEEDSNSVNGVSPYTITVNCSSGTFTRSDKDITKDIKFYSVIDLQKELIDWYNSA